MCSIHEQQRLLHTRQFLLVSLATQHELGKPKQPETKGIWKRSAFLKTFLLEEIPMPFSVAARFAALDLPHSCDAAIKVIELGLEFRTLFE